MFAALIPALLPIIGDVLGRFLPEDKEAAARAKQEIEQQLTTHLAQIDLAQLEINKAEASHRSIFVAGWRPFVGWTAGLSLALTYVLFPLVQFGFNMYGMRVEVPDVGAGAMMPIITAMLGFGGLRTFEKMKGLAK